MSGNQQTAGTPPAIDESEQARRGGALAGYAVLLGAGLLMATVAAALAWAETRGADGVDWTTLTTAQTFAFGGIAIALAALQLLLGERGAKKCLEVQQQLLAAHEKRILDALSETRPYEERP